MFEKVSPSHPDKLADRLSGAIVDLAYERSEGGFLHGNPRIAVEVLAGHNRVDVQIETSLGRLDLRADDIDPLIHRLFGERVEGNVLIAPQDPHLSDNQTHGLRCGDNGIFKGCPPTEEQRVLTAIAATMWERWPYDGKFIINDTKPIPSRALLSADENLEWEVKMRRRCDIMEEMDELLTPIRTFNKEEEKRWNGLVAEEKKIKERLDELIEKEKRIAREMRGLNFTICQSNAEEKEIRDFLNSKLSTLNYQLKVNPLGPWTGGINVDCGCTNRKLGSDMGDGVTGGGLMGKDLSKADVSVNIVCHLKAVASGQVVTAVCSIGDENVTFVYHAPSAALGDAQASLAPHSLARGFTYPDGYRETERFADIVEQARLYILTDCGGSFEKFAEWGLVRPLAQV